MGEVQEQDGPGHTERISDRIAHRGIVIAKRDNRSLEGRRGCPRTREQAQCIPDLKARGLCADMLAELLVDGLEGMRMRSPGMETQKVAVRQLVRVIELAIKP